MKSPELWDSFADAQEAVTSTIAETVGEQGFLANVDYVERDDYWRNGDDYVGPGGAEQGELRAKLMGPTQRQHTPVPVCTEAVQRVVNALTKRQADIAFVPLNPAPEGSPEAERLAEEGAQHAADIADWWDQKKVWLRAKDAVRSSTYAARGYLRPWIAPRNLERQKDGTTKLPTGLEMRDALSRVEVSAPRADAAVVWTDPDTLTTCATILYKEGDVAVAEVWVRDGDYAVMRKVRERAGVEAAVDQPLRVRLKHSLLPLAEMRAEPLLTASVRQQQARLNFFESILLRVVETAGFPERYISNAKPNGVWLRNKPLDRPALETWEDPESADTWYLVAAPRTLGSAITTELRGINTGTTEEQSIATPAVTRFEPTDPDFAIKAAMHARATILRTVKQAHMVAEGAAQLSGIAYEQARTDFEDDLESRKTALEEMLAVLIAIAVRYAEIMGKNPEESILDRFRIVVTVHVSAGPVSTERLKATDDLRKAGLITRRTAMSRVGVEDPSAEMQEIEASWEEQIRFKKARAELLGMLKDILPMYEAAIEAGYTEEEARRMAKVDAPYEEAPV